MWKLLPLCLLVACTTNDQQKPSSGESQPHQGRIVRQVVLPIESATKPIDNQPAKKSFRAKGLEGWLDETGAWHINAEVHHTRLRCGTYETGIQVGRGNPACVNVEWLSGVEYATRIRHCNSASRLHAGGGKFSDSVNHFNMFSCVRVVVRCEGTC